jgi:DNA replication protein DnaC
VEIQAGVSRRSTIITSQIPVDKWHELIGDPTYADAILDRIVHNAHRINLTGHTLRRSCTTKQQRSDLPPDAKTAVEH